MRVCIHAHKAHPQNFKNVLKMAHQKLHPQRRYAEFRFIGYIKCDLYVGVK